MTEPFSVFGTNPSTGESMAPVTVETAESEVAELVETTAAFPAASTPTQPPPG